MNPQNAVQAYQQAHHQGKIENASPHQLIQLLMEGALSRIAQAKICMTHGNMGEKSVLIGKAISIVGGLQGSLDMDAKGDISNNLDSLYDYMVRKLLEANQKNDAAILDEISGLILEIKGAWDAIPEEFHHASPKK
jgi:flagellar protein FliS